MKRLKVKYCLIVLEFVGRREQGGGLKGVNIIYLCFFQNRRLLIKKTIVLRTWEQFTHKTNATNNGAEFIKKLVNAIKHAEGIEDDDIELTEDLIVTESGVDYYKDLFVSGSSSNVKLEELLALEDPELEGLF